MSEQQKREKRRALLQAARERGWLTLEELMDAASGSLVDLEDAVDTAREAGLDLVDRRGDAWADLQTLADEGPGAFKAVSEAPAPLEELMPGGPAALYLREISQTPLLSAEEEVHLAKQLEAGREAEQRLARGVDDAVERAELEQAAGAGQSARHRLIEANLRLVVSVARKYLGRGLSFLDLVQEGNIGLQRGVDKYDWRRGFRFSTYAYWWIRQAIGRAVSEQSRTIRLPVHVIEQLTKLYNAGREIEHEQGRPATPEQIGARLGVEPERVREAFLAARVPISLETPIGEEQGATIADLIADGARAPAEEAEDEVLAETLEEALAKHLTPREAEALRLRFGLGGDRRERTLNEVGQELGVSRERARQLEAEAMRKLRRTTPFREQFREYVG